MPKLKNFGKRGNYKMKNSMPHKKKKTTNSKLSETMPPLLKLGTQTQNKPQALPSTNSLI